MKEDPHKLVTYQLFIDRFSRGVEQDKEHNSCAGPVFCGGNLRGVRERLDYIEGLGVNAIWLSPFCKTSAYHGYHITDLYEVEPRFGTLEDLKQLLRDCHRHGIKVFMDFVANHVSNEHRFFKDAQQNENSEYHDWFYWEDWPNDYLCFLDYRELPKLNLKNKKAREHVIGAAKQWLDAGIDGFRLDHVCGPSHEFWEEFVREIKKYKADTLLFGEAALFGVGWEHRKTILMNNKTLALLMHELGMPNTEFVMKEYVDLLDGILDFEFNRIMLEEVARKGEVKDAEDRLKKHYESYPRKFLLFSFLDNHDMNRFLYEAGNDKDRLMLAAKIQMEQAQPVVVYNGTEMGVTQERSMGDVHEHGDLEVRPMMPWDNMDETLLTFYRQIIKAKTGRK